MLESSSVRDSIGGLRYKLGYSRVATKSGKSWKIRKFMFHKRDSEAKEIFLLFDLLFVIETHRKYSSKIISWSLKTSLKVFKFFLLITTRTLC